MWLAINNIQRLSCSWISYASYVYHVMLHSDKIMYGHTIEEFFDKKCNRFSIFVKMHLAKCLWTCITVIPIYLQIDFCFQKWLIETNFICSWMSRWYKNMWFYSTYLRNGKLWYMLTEVSPRANSFIQNEPLKTLPNNFSSLRVVETFFAKIGILDSEFVRDKKIG